MASSQSRRAQRLNQRAGGTEKLTAEDIFAVEAIWGDECFYCLKPLTHGVNLTFDHLVSLVNGGRNIKRNLVPCCDRCNQLKRDKFAYWDSDRHKIVFRYEAPKKRRW